ncbi:MAG TPA: DUF11 domain-containing protein [Gaiellales bacterium]|nr:DUF11 domain-containing protein [Gaiellales bacterium]
MSATQASAAVSPSQIVRPFTVRYAINTNGDIATAANTLLTCPVGAIETQSHVGCTDVQNGGIGDDNYFDMGYVNVDNDPATFDSSSANLSVPAGATVLFAGLYWGAALDQGETLPLQCDPAQPRTGAAAANPAAAGSAMLKGPGAGGYVPVNASVFDTYTEDLGCPSPGADERTRYQGFADVTSFVQQQGGGSYTVANVQAGTGADRHAGWSLVVAYQDASLPARNLTIFDGFGQVALNAHVPITVSGFKTPLAPAAVNTQIGVVAYEGDRNLTGDGLALNGTPLGDVAHPSGNFFDSSISTLGTPVSGSTPDYKNQLGFDAGVLAVPAGVVKNGDTSATIDLTTVNDRYLPGVVYFRTDIYAPQMVLHKTVTDLNGGDVRPGDVLQYDINSTNTGQTSAYDARINDAIPAFTSYQPDTLTIVTSPGTGVVGKKSDPTDADQAEYDSGPNEVRFRVGTGATALNGGGPLSPDGGGVIAPGESFSVRFDVVVAANAGDGTQILNTAVLSSKDENGVDYTSIASAPAAVTVGPVPDVTILKSHTGIFVRGGQGTFSLLVSNVGGRPTSGTVVIDDTLPAGLGVVSASGTNWTCSVSTAANSLHCERADPLAAGAAYEPVGVVVNVLENAPDTVTNTGVTGGGSETNTSNNTDDDTVPITSNADVAIVKSVTPTTTPPSNNVTYSLVVTNNGPSTAKDVKVADPMPAGMSFVSVTPAACGLDGIVVRCSLGNLVKGQSVTITLVSGIPLSLANKTKTNEATVSSSTPDSDLTNNKDNATVKIKGLPPSKILVRKSAKPASVALTGGNSPVVSFTIVLKVPSKIDAKQVDVCDTLPAHMVVATRSLKGGGALSNGRVCWHLDLAKAQSTHEFTFKAKVDKDFQGGSLKNVVVATSGNAPKVSANATVDVAHVGGKLSRQKSRVTG